MTLWFVLEHPVGRRAVSYAVAMDGALKLSGRGTYLNCSLNDPEDDQHLEELVDEVNLTAWLIQA